MFTKPANEYELYQHYLALKLHFSRDNFDYFKYGGKIKAKVETFKNRNDFYFFKKLSKHKDPLSYILANILHSNAWIGDLVHNTETDKVYYDWMKCIQSLTYTFTNDLKQLKANFDLNFIVEDGNHPYILQLYLQRKISLETLAILVYMTGCSRYWYKAMKHDVVWSSLQLRVLKYVCFLEFDKKKFRSIVTTNFGGLSKEKEELVAKGFPDDTLSV